jgi:hypothetical protein
VEVRSSLLVITLGPGRLKFSGDYGGHTPGATQIDPKFAAVEECSSI